MRPLMVKSTLLAAAVLVGTATAGEIGDKAAKLDVKEWVKGEPVDVSNGTYVVEFWATWCGPCVKAIPHVTEMQKKFKDKVTVIGVSVDDEDTVADVKPFVEKQGDAMGYTVAIDNDGATADAYMDAFDRNGIPHAFVVHNGQVVFHHSPYGEDPSIEDVLTEIVSGKFDLDKLRKARAEIDRQEAEMEKLFKLQSEYVQLARSTGQAAEAKELGAKLIKEGGENAGLMNSLAWTILTDPAIVDRDLKLALEAAERANKATKGEDASILDTYALALYQNGKAEAAVKQQEKAVKLAREGNMTSLLEELEGRLKLFKAGETFEP